MCLCSNFYSKVSCEFYLILFSALRMSGICQIGEFRGIKKYSGKCVLPRTYQGKIKEFH